MKVNITRFTCDAPNCKDKVDVETPGAAVQAIVGHEGPSLLPDGWIEIAVAGATVEGEVVMRHASKPECAAALAEHQVEQAVEAAEKRADEEAAESKRVEEARDQALDDARKQEAERAVAVEEAAKQREADAEAAEVAEER